MDNRQRGTDHHAFKHGQSTTKLYGVWLAMKRRCDNPKVPAFKNYGGRGIRVCARWLDFRLFLEDMLPTYREGLTLERIDNDGNYEPDNCKWATRDEQGRNRRGVAYLEIDGKRMTYREASQLCGVAAKTLKWRMKAGWPIAHVLAPKNSCYGKEPIDRD